MREADEGGESGESTMGGEGGGGQSICDGCQPANHASKALNAPSTLNVKLDILP